MKGDIYKASKTLLGTFFYEYIAGVRKVVFQSKIL